MNPQIVVSAHLSSLFASAAHVVAHVVPTARRDLPLPAVNTQSAHPDGHASGSSLFNHPLTGQLLLRVVQGGLAIELLSLTTGVPPVRFVFPAAVLPSPALILWQERQLHLLALTSVGSLYRIILPIYEGSQLWHEPLRKDWYREYQVAKFSASYVSVCYVQDFHTVILGLRDGGCLRLYSEFVEEEKYDETWVESEYRANNWYASFLPQLSSDTSHPAEVVAMSSLPPPTDVTDVFSLSRDRCLRRWTVTKGYRQEITLAAPLGMSNTNEKSANLLPNGPQKLLQVYSAGLQENAVDDQAVLVFLPTPNSTTAGGLFESYVLMGNLWGPAGSCLCSKASVHARLQDFILSEGRLYVLWEKQGQSLLEVTNFPKAEEYEWEIIPCAVDTELTRSGLNELLLTPGSLADKCLQAIMRPGVFSPYTLRGAIHEYAEHYLSLPGSRHPALLTSYATLSEHIAAVVGCTVELVRDHQTSSIQHQQYWNSLRRDWEGFIARCREIERSARWPLALGLGETTSDILIVERERVGRCSHEDAPMRSHRLLENSLPLEPVYALLDTCWTLRAKLDSQLIRQIEIEVQNVLSQELAFPLADIVVEASNRAFSHEDLDEGLESWVTSRLTSIEDLDQGIRTVLDIIGGLDQAVKQEEDEVELIIPPPISEWNRALIAAYICETVEVRYDLCLTLAAMLFFLGDSLKQYDPTLLGEVFAVFRGVTMLRFLCQRPAGDPDGAKPSMQESSPSDDVVARMSNLHMSRGLQNPTPTFSLLHRLLAQTGQPALVPAAAHHFLDQTGLLSTVSPALATRSEVSICERLRLLGYHDTAEQMAGWLPRTPAVCYVLGRLGIALGRGDDSALILQSIAGCFGPDGAISFEDHEALAAVLPGARFFLSEFEYYLHIAEIFRAASLTAYEVQYSRFALSCSPEDTNTLELWAAMFKGYIDLGLFEDAYMTLVTSPYDELKRLCVAQLVYSMCEGGAIDRLMSLNTGDIAGDVEEALSFKVRNTDPRVAPFYSQILYTWFISREDYRSAAMAMYIRARKLAELQGDPTQAISLIEDQAEALLVAANALSLVDGKNPWVVVPLSAGGSREHMQPRKRRKLDNLIPDYKFALEHRDVDIVTLSDIQNEHILLSAQTILWQRDPSLLHAGDLSLGAWAAVSKLTQAGLFDLAMYTASALTIDMTELFQRLSVQCLRLSAAQDSSLLEGPADWLLTDKVSSWSGRPAERGWRYLRQSLEHYDKPETDFKYSKAVFETLLSHDSLSPPPTWLTHTLEERHPEYLIRTYLLYDLFESALEHTLSLIRKEKPPTSRRYACRTWLPYTLIDAVLKAAEEDPISSPRIADLQRTLRTEVSGRISRTRKDTEKAP